MHRFFLKKHFFCFVHIKWLTLVLKHLLKTACIHTIKQLKKGKEPVLWIRIKDTEEKFDAKSIFDLVDKEIKGKFETNYFAKQQIRKYKRHGSKLIKNEKFMYAHKCIIIPVIMHCRVSTPKSTEFRSKLGFNQYEITLTIEQSVLKSVMDALKKKICKFNRVS